MTINNYCLLLADKAQFQVGILAEKIAKLKKIPFAEASHIVKHSWGILDRHCDESQARMWQQQYADVGILTKIIPDADLSLPQANLIKKMKLVQPGLVVYGPDVKEEQIDFQTIQLIAALAYDHTTTLIEKIETGPSRSQKAAKLGMMLATGIPIPIGGNKEIKEVKREIHDFQFLMDIFTPFRRFRIEANSFDFSHLGPEKEMNVMNNFKRVLANFLQHCPHAMTNKGADFIRDKKPLNQLGYESLGDFEKESYWLMALTSFGTSS